ncbi:MAG: Bicarbonate transport system permease protein CmpB [Nocardioides sp.]|nr:Bicarbonate transport system permease protein CmpB [Nocardioides sp.]
MTMTATQPTPPETDGSPQRSAARVRRRSGGSPLIGLLPLVVALAVWQVAGDPRSPYYPPPSRWWEELTPLWQDGTMTEAIRATLTTLLLSLIVATIAGTVIGGAVGASRRADRALGPLLEFLRVLPAAALVPLAALVLGYTLQMKMAVVVLPATWPILLACRSARRSVSPTLIDASRSLGLSRAQRFRKILLLSLAPGILLGLRVAAPLALIITILVEIVTRVDGVGSLMGEAQANYRSAQVYGLLAVAGIIGFLINWVVTRVESHVTWRMTGS